jgi:xanthine dehydrogenase accessory factor
VQLAPTLGWCVTVAHPRERLGNTPARSLSPTTLQDWRRAHPHGAAVLMTHNPALDRLGLQQLASGSPALPYVGVLGPRARTLALAKDAGLSDAETARLHAPVGLPLGGEGPAAIALSIVAQLEQLTSGHKP